MNSGVNRTVAVYTDEIIHPDWIVASDNRVQVDHILPWSRRATTVSSTRRYASPRQIRTRKGEPV